MATMKKPKPKVYLAGPITGQKDGNRAVFKRGKVLVEAMGYTAINPHDIEKWLRTKHREDAVTERKIMGTCLQVICERADAMLVLNFNGNWMDSEGTTAEYMAAKKCRIPIFVAHRDEKTKRVLCELQPECDTADRLTEGDPWRKFPTRFEEQVEAHKK